MKFDKNLDLLAVNTLKINALAAINKANSGHSGIVLSAANIMHTLFTRHLVFSSKAPKWINRDRFVLSAGHGSALLYAQLRALGLLTQKDLEEFRQIHSKTPGHPENFQTLGVDATTGPLGQGIANAVGLTVAESHLNSKYPEINHYTYVLVGDGDLQEGVANEALSFAGRQQLNKLIILHDSNRIQLDTPVSDVFNEDLRLKMEALGFHYQSVPNKIKKISKAIAKAKKSLKPSFIEVRTIIGEGSTKENTTDVHGTPLGKDLELLKEKLNWSYDEFALPDEVRDYYRQALDERFKEAENKFVASEYLKDFLKKSFEPMFVDLDLSKNDSTRNYSGKIVDYLGEKSSNWIGGSADLSVSTKVKGSDGDFCPVNRAGRNILFGVREFAMAGIANGIALHSTLRPFVSTFFVFSDYLKPAIRLSSMMNLPVTYIFSHDSVFVGEDGPTHQPIEQLAMLRSIPGVKVLRPADETETKAAFELAINSRRKPHIIVTTRQNIKSLDETSFESFKKGSYFLQKTDSPYALIATGSELKLAQRIGKRLNLNVISASNWDGKVLWDPNKSISFEAATTFGWEKYARCNVGIDSFGISAPGEQVYKHFNFEYNFLKHFVMQTFDLVDDNPEEDIEVEEIIEEPIVDYIEEPTQEVDYFEEESHDDIVEEFVEEINDTNNETNEYFLNDTIDLPTEEYVYDVEPTQEQEVVFVDENLIEDDVVETVFEESTIEEIEEEQPILVEETTIEEEEEEEPILVEESNIDEEEIIVTPKEKSAICGKESDCQLKLVEHHHHLTKKDNNDNNSNYVCFNDTCVDVLDSNEAKRK
ncbi:transketolase [Mesomycoplasma neurolyticum]|uniref:transketolase n=1 Tax=Mesomycoplasma neurolyticum TaxID=2120 RepID=A0A449A4C3_9BACT|nr:transketolase [Mesomycoplasma neurolyticum]VEU59089.1 Transketolase [Mesomycoplasma neurolyticum]